MRYFEKISFEEFEKAGCGTKEDYEAYNIPVRKTRFSAGYDFVLINDLTLKPNEVKKVATGIKARMREDEVLMLFVRSSVGFKHNVRLTNQVGIVDYDYYNNESNEGHIFLSLQNHSDKEVSFKKGEGICQGIFVKYQTVDNEEEISTSRKGGIGSTNKGE